MTDTSMTFSGPGAQSAYMEIQQIQHPDSNQRKAKSSSAKAKGSQSGSAAMEPRGRQEERGCMASLDFAHGNNLR